MKDRPRFFLAPGEIDHDGEIFDYIRELYDYLWRFVRATLSPGTSGNLRDFLDEAIHVAEAAQAYRLINELGPDTIQAEFRTLEQELVHRLQVLGFSHEKAKSLVRSASAEVECQDGTKGVQEPLYKDDVITMLKGALKTIDPE